MKKQDFKFALLRAFAHQLQNFADFVLAHTEEEHTDPEGDSTNQDVDEISASWLTTMEADAPPAHWLERVRQGAPELLEQRGSPRQQAPRNVPNQPVDIPEHNSELLPAEIADMTPLAKKQHIQSRKLHDQYGQIDSAHSRAPFSEPISEHKKEQEEEVSLSGKNRVGAAWSAYHLLVYHTLTARKPAPLSASTRPFPPLPKKYPEERIDSGASMVEEVRDEHQPLRRLVLDSPPTGAVEYATEQRTQPRSNVPSYPGKPWAVQSSIEETASRQETIVPSKQWPTMSPAANQTRSRRDLSAWTSETYPQMRWPSLPEEEATDHQRWEMMRRSWERQQRLNEEQRGVSWNA